MFKNVLYLQKCYLPWKKTTVKKDPHLQNLVDFSVHASTLNSQNPLNWPETFLPTSAYLNKWQLIKLYEIIQGPLKILSGDTAQKMNFLLRISSVNVTKSAGNCGFINIYWRNPKWKTSFFVQWEWIVFAE